MVRYQTKIERSIEGKTHTSFFPKFFVKISRMNIVRVVDEIDSYYRIHLCGNQLLFYYSYILYYLTIIVFYHCYVIIRLMCIIKKEI